MSTEACNKIAELGAELGKAQIIVQQMEQRIKQLEEQLKSNAPEMNVPMPMHQGN